VRSPIRKRIRAGDDLEPLGLDRVHVRDRHGAAGPQRELERKQLTARRARGVREREALAGDGVLERLAGSDGGVECGAHAAQ
jgi:hypothetical protein